RPTVEPVIVVQEKLPVAQDRVPDEQKRRGRHERSKASVVYRRPLVAFVEPSHHEPIVDIGPSCHLIQDLFEETLGTTRRQIGEKDYYGFVIHGVAIHALSVQELRLVSVDELDHVRHAASGDVFRSEPEILSLKGLGNEGTHGPTAAEILVRPGHETVDPTRDG